MGNEGNPPVKRRKLGKNEGKNKVIEIGSSSKPSKKEIIDDKEDIDVDKKAYPPGPMTLLLLTYVYNVKVPINNLKKGRPFISYVTANHLDDIQKEYKRKKSKKTDYGWEKLKRDVVNISTLPMLKRIYKHLRKSMAMLRRIVQLLN
ncbi:hypothetical protein L2E82_35762 [Cichorium intybus]|uniref:Uncharacterized protein n=1 Tax=Cichorium intybus TaxID=13427 RepID=A0ACB9BPZ6_CICIN|nr:hypothetical protein L2E82_35762 [Cichorium intybus]